MPIRFLGLIFASALLSACAGADYPGFVDATVEATTGVDLQDGLDDSRNPRNRASSTAQETQAPRASQPAVTASRDTRSLQNILHLYSDWSVLLVAADFRTTQGTTTDAFDNARRAMANRLAQIGFEPENMAHLSVRPERYGDPRVHLSSYDNMRNDLRRERRSAGEGCLVYITSHGTPEGVAVGANAMLTPVQLNEILETQCGSDPTILIVSACYSGVFASDEMLQPNRFIMTAARSDRSSFGCGEGDEYPYFDACLINSMPQSTDWLDFARNTRTCVETREHAERLSPPSSPQIYVGPEIRDIATSPFISLDYGPPTSGL